MQQSKSKEIYYNKKQLQFLRSTAETSVFIGGRGAGKTTVILGRTMLRFNAMPGAKAFLSSTTYNQIETKTLPAMLSKLAEYGFKEGIHFCIGTKPPKWFKSPLAPVRDHKYMWYFFNGYCVEFLSLDRPDKARGGSYQAGDIDEAALVKQEHYTRVLKYSTRGYAHKFHGNPYYRQIGMYTSVPWTPRGYWLLDYEDKAKADPNKYFFIESTAWDNVDVLGADTIKGWQNETPYLEYQVEVMNRRVKQAKDSFYNKLDVDRHGYDPVYKYGEGKRGIETVGRDDMYKRNKILDLSFDFGGWFNCVTIWQEQDYVERCIEAMYVKEENKIVDLVDQFCTTYASHSMKVVRIWGEPRGHDKNPITEDIYNIIKKRFERNGWRCDIKAHAGRTTNHKERHTFVNDILSEQHQHLPKVRIHRENAKHLILSMQLTEIKPDFTKDKSNEKDRKYPQEQATHFTDTLDYYLVQKYQGRLAGTPSHRASGAWM